MAEDIKDWYEPKLQVVELFRSIDGEVNGFAGPGQPSFFIRLAGCNLKREFGSFCGYCDTAGAQDENTGRTMGLSEIVTHAERGGLQKITVTGGEPLYQFEEVRTLVNTLAQLGYLVTVETNGTVGIPREWLENDRVRIVADYKLRSSGVDCRSLTERVLESLRPCDVTKFILMHPNDLFEVAFYIYDHNPKAQLYVSPVSGKLLPEELELLIESIASIPALKNRVSLNFQLHKLLGIK